MMQSVLEFITNSEISPELLDATILKTQNLNLLNALLEIKINYLNTRLDHRKINFNIDFIYTNDTENIDLICLVLKKVLLVSENVREPILGITRYIIQQHDLNNKLKVIRILHTIITFCSEDNELQMLFLHLETDFINSLLIQALLQKDVKVVAYETLKYYFSVLATSEQNKCLNAILQFSYENNNLDVLCAILNQVSGELTENKECCFNTDQFWLYVESCISGTDIHLQKQGEFILLKYVKALHKYNTNDYVAVSGNKDTTWDAFFTLVDIGREKQLHLVEQSLHLIKYVCNLSFLWQKCVYTIYLRHSQSTIVYRIAIYLLSQSYKGDDLKDILKILLPAVNKNEYNDLSCEMFDMFRKFCSNLDEKGFHALLKEIVLITWNPISFWKVLQNVFILKHRRQISVDYFQEIISCVANLPHIYIRTECIKYLINLFWDEQSFFKMYKIVCALQKNEIKFHKYCLLHCEISPDISDFVINELLNLNENCNDLEKIKICAMFLENMTYCTDIFCTLHKYLHKLSPHIKLLVWNIYFNLFSSEQPILFYRQIEQFLVHYFIEYLNEEMADSFLKLFERLIQIKMDYFSSEGAVKKLTDAIFNANNYNKIQIYVSFAVLSTYIHHLYSDHLDFSIVNENMCHTIIENWRLKIVGERDEKLCKEYIRFIFIVNNNKFAMDDTILVIKIFTSMMKFQNNNVVDYIYEKTSTLLELTESQQLVIDFINLCHKNIKTIKRDQYFKGIIDKLFQVVYSPLYLSHNLKNIISLNQDFLELTKAYPVLRLNWIKAVHTLFMDGFKHFNEFVLTIIDIYLQGVVVTKDARTEFYVCQEFLEDVDLSNREYSPWYLDATSNPNLLNAASRLVALEVLLYIAKHDTDLVINSLREKYLTFFKKRYFPDSEIHFQKLRITQAILMLIPYVQQSLKSTRQIVIFMYDCFLEEANQNCIKQLFNWILTLLLKVQEFAVIEYITRITTTPTPASASVLVGLVPAVYYLCVYGDKKAFDETIRLILPWTMGAQFKLRVYAQDLLKRLFKYARENDYKSNLEKYKHLEDCINISIDSTGTIFENTMKTDFLFLNNFDLIGDNSLKTIFCDIPRLNNVSRTEWQSIHFYISRPYCLDNNEILYEKTPLCSQSTTFSDAVDAYLYKEKSSSKVSEDQDIASLHIQKKITPWKTALENVDHKIKSDFILIASLIDKPQNLGGLSRTCEVFGIKSLVLNDAKIIKDKEFKSLSMSSEFSMNIIEVKIKDLEDYISMCHKEGYCVVGAEQTAGSLKLNEFRFPQKTAVILGNEKTGIPPKLIPLLDVCLEIPQFGQVRSLNVHVAGATFIWEYAKQHLV